MTPQSTQWPHPHVSINSSLRWQGLPRGTGHPGFWSIKSVAKCIRKWQSFFACADVSLLPSYHLERKSADVINRACNNSVLCSGSPGNDI